MRALIVACFIGFCGCDALSCSNAPQAVQAACQDFCGLKALQDTGLFFEVTSLSFHHGRWYCECAFQSTPRLTAYDETGMPRKAPLPWSPGREPPPVA